MDLLNKAREAATEGPKPKTDDTDWAFGPVPVGNIGQVGVIMREFPSGTFPYARFVPTSGRPSGMNLAACESLIDALKADAEAEAPEAEAAPEADESTEE